ncbi:MAG: IclR family transcriptional regulator C-terminal domain-containing protein [Desulfohalobiaceae bacterium]|nr:IclR family transcriptional regulator C-terminal domain-containing protein [Desulfohalobiaceae bacterium]
MARSSIICRVNTSRILPYDIRLGTTLPVHCTSMGKALLAFCSRAKIESAMSFLDEDVLQDLGRETESPGSGVRKQAKRPVAMK